jgi:SAM-dependent methyltransferase
MVDKAVKQAASFEASSALFQNEWSTYRKVVENNYMFHREAYRCLRKILLDEVNFPFHFLDIACGDASASAEALKGTSVRHYCGVDLSKPALSLAEDALKVLACPVVLKQCDFVEALYDWNDPVEVVWIGQSLHHLLTPVKLALMREVRRIIGENGLFLIWEPTSPDGEDRQGA